jgi:hypothetical protein
MLARLVQYELNSHTLILVKKKVAVADADHLVSVAAGVK